MGYRDLYCRPQRSAYWNDWAGIAWIEISRGWDFIAIRNILLTLSYMLRQWVISRCGLLERPWFFWISVVIHPISLQGPSQVLLLLHDRTMHCGNPFVFPLSASLRRYQIQTTIKWVLPQEVVSNAMRLVRAQGPFTEAALDVDNEAQRMLRSCVMREL